MTMEDEHVRAVHVCIRVNDGTEIKGLVTGDKDGKSWSGCVDGKLLEISGDLATLVLSQYTDDDGATAR